MVKIRLNRAGAKKRPFYRLVAIDERLPTSGRALEFLGTYDPQSDPAKLSIKLDRVDAWLEKGAQLSDTARSIVKRARKTGAAAAASSAEAVS
jgi:small subunit ribosomal protein S16